MCLNNRFIMHFGVLKNWSIHSHPPFISNSLSSILLFAQIFPGLYKTQVKCPSLAGFLYSTVSRKGGQWQPSVIIMQGHCTLRKICSACFLQESYFWKILCIFCTFFHLLSLLVSCFLERPTVISYETKPLSAEEVPDLLVCREDGFDKKKLELYGYNQKKISEYIKGRNDKQFIGWSGTNESDPLR